jgi:signal peptidase I
MRASSAIGTADEEGRKPLLEHFQRLQEWAGRALLAVMAFAVLVALAAGLGPRLLPYRTYEVLSGSMAPALPVGSLIVDLPSDAGSIQPRDVITFPRPDNPGEMVTHRVIARQQGPFGPVFVTKGDANGVPDSWRVSATGTAWKLTVAVPLAGYMLGLVRTPIGLLLTLLVPGLVLLGMAAHDLWRATPGGVA